MKRRKPQPRPVRRGQPSPNATPPEDRHTSGPAVGDIITDKALEAQRRRLRRLLFQELAREIAPIAYEWSQVYPEWAGQLLKTRTFVE